MKGLFDQSAAPVISVHRNKVLAIFNGRRPSQVRRIDTQLVVAGMRRLVSLKGRPAVPPDADVTVGANSPPVHSHHAVADAGSERPKYALRCRLKGKESLHKFERRSKHCVTGFRAAVSPLPKIVAIAEPLLDSVLVAIVDAAYACVSHVEESFRLGQGRGLLAQLFRPVFLAFSASDCNFQGLVNRRNSEIALCMKGL